MMEEELPFSVGEVEFVKRPQEQNSLMSFFLWNIG
jgi:hypothetical protein